MTLETLATLEPETVDAAARRPERGLRLPIIGRVENADSIDILELSGCDHVLDLHQKLGARLAVAPMQDFLALDSTARMNRPGVAAGNWRWRLAAGALTPRLAARVCAKCQACGRDATQCAK